MSNQFQSTEQLSQSIALAEQRIKEYTKQIEALGNTYAENIIHRELCEAIDNAEAHIAEMKWYLESPEHADNTVESTESSACTRNTNTHQSNEETNMNVHNTVVETSESLELNELRFQLGVNEDLLKEAKAVVNSFEYNPSEDVFNDWLNDLYGNVSVAYFECTASELLKKMSPTDYRVMRNDFINSVDIEDLDEYKELIQAVEDLETEIESIQEQIDELQV